MFTIVKVENDMTTDQLDVIRAEFSALSNASDDVIIDLRNVALLDEAGVSAIIWLFKRLHAQGRSLELINVREQPMHLLSQLRLCGVLTARPATKRIRRRKRAMDWLNGQLTALSASNRLGDFSNRMGLW